MKPSQMFSHWEQVRTDLLATMNKFSDDELSYTPFVGSWSVGQILLHIAECEDFWLHSLVRHELEPPIDYKQAEYPTRFAIKEVLDNAHRRTVAFLDNLDMNELDNEYPTRYGESFTLRWIIWHVLEHEIHHRGELSLALGLLGREGLEV
ncbi:MAG TPA: DinB family protein [Anaerolineales bacterium]|nr:DinB family protein [Anaerolineales bacterium]